MSLLRTVGAFLGLSLALIWASAPAGAQQRDSLRAGVSTPPAASRTDTIPAQDLPAPPLSTKRAFLTSLAFPGYAQARFDRPTSSALFMAVEAASIVMIRKSLNDLSIAKRFGRDSIPAAFELDPATGAIRRDPESGEPIVKEWMPPPFSEEMVAARRTHLEDWIAVLVFNHLIAGIDAYVSAHLWDVPAAVSIGQAADGRGATVTASFRW